MNRLRGLILIFCLALSVPLAYLILQTYNSLAQEEAAKIRYFADKLFYEMEQGLVELVRLEEARPIDVYNFLYQPESESTTSAALMRSPLSVRPDSAFIIGYFQNNQDGSFQTPLVKKGEPPAAEFAQLVGELAEINRQFNGKRSRLPGSYEISPPTAAHTGKSAETAFADRYLKLDSQRRLKTSLGQEKKRVETITPSQALNIAQLDEMPIQQPKSAEKERDQAIFATESETPAHRSAPAAQAAPLASADLDKSPPITHEKLEIEVDPLQSVMINDQRIFMFRRIIFQNEIYRQGFVIDATPFLNYLSTTYFAEQPLAQYTGLKLSITDGSRTGAMIQTGKADSVPLFTVERVFPRPFSYLRATLNCANIPENKGQRTLTLMVSVLAGIILIGMFAIYRSARVVMDLSARRANFVSSVTHELKTPLTNIRMYIEMLEQGIAATPEREQHYFQILNSESARLSRLINNVLEFSRIEQKKYRLDVKTGDFDDVILEICRVMQEKLRHEGFALTVNKRQPVSFAYDREVMIQILINLMENSMKFSTAAQRKEIVIKVFQDEKSVIISVADFGPGIPKHALKKVFHDFYRVDNPQTRAARGAGIGLALVKKLATAMGGHVKAENNSDAGCTISVEFKNS